MTNVNPSAGALIMLAIAIPLYFLPAIIAGCRGKVSGTAGVVLLNIFLGWTVIGWWVALIWAFTGRTAADVRLEAQRHYEMLAALKGPPPCA